MYLVTIRACFRDIPSSFGIALLAVLLLTGAHAKAATYYVAKTGSDANSCTQARNASTPKKSIGSALGCESPGDTVEVGDGTYAEEVNNTISAGISPSRRTTLRAKNRGRVIIKPNSGTRPVRISGSHIALIGLVLDAANVSNDALKVEVGSHFLLFEDLETRNSPHQGILIQSSNNGIMRRIDSHHNGSGKLDHGLYLNNSSDWLIDASEFHHNSGTGAQLYAQPKRTTVQQSSFYNNCTKVQSGSQLVVAHQDHSIRNVDVYKTSGNCTNGVTVNLQGASGSTLDHLNVSCSVGTCSTGISVGPDVPNTRIRNSIILGFSTPIKNSGIGTKFVANRTSGSPTAIWTSPGTGDFTLRASSVAIDAGTDIGLPFNGGAPDQGAHETGGVTTPPPPPPPQPEAVSIEYLFDGNGDDTSGGERHATMNGTSFVVGKFGEGLQTNAGENDYAEVPWIKGVDPTRTSFTIAYGVFIPASDMGTRRHLGGIPWFGQRFNVFRSDTDNFRLATQDNFGTTATEFDVVGDRWAFVCVTADSATNTVNLSVNGVDGSVDGGSVQTVTPYTLGGNYRVGTPERIPAAGGGAHIFDEFRIYPSVENCADLYAAFAPDDGNAPDPNSCSDVTACTDNDGCCPENCLGNDLDCTVTGTVSCTDDGKGGKICSVTDITGCAATFSTPGMAWLTAVGLFGISARRRREKLVRA